MAAAEHLDKFVDVFLNWQAVLISFAVFVVLSLVRKVGTQVGKDGTVKGFAQNKWFQIGLPIYPYLLALLFCLLPKAPLPEIVQTSLATKILYGLYTGWMPDKAVQLIKHALEKVGVKVALEP